MGRPIASTKRWRPGVVLSDGIDSRHGWTAIGASRHRSSPLDGYRHVSPPEFVSQFRRVERADQRQLAAEGFVSQFFEQAAVVGFLSE